MVNTFMKIHEITSLSADEPTRIKIGGAEAAAKAKTWIEKVYAKYPQTMQNNHVMTWGSGDDLQFAMFELVPSFSKRGAVEVKWFQAYPLRAGVGSRAMKELQAMAREDGISLTLFPWDKGQVSQSKLTKFYRGQGFAPTVKGGKAMQWSPELAEGVEQRYLTQISNLAWKPLTRGVWNTIQDEGLDEEQDAPKHTDWVMASLDVSAEDARALQSFDDNAIEDFNRFDIQLKSRYPGLTDLIDYDNGTVTIVKPLKQGVAESRLNEFAPGAGDEGGEDPYRYPKPERYARSADYFGQFEADHFDREDFDDAAGVFKGYWGSTPIAYFKFADPARTSGNDPGMGWYYEPESNGSSDAASAAPAIDRSAERKQQELGMIDKFLKSGQTPKPGSQIYSMMKRHGLA